MSLDLAVVDLSSVITNSGRTTVRVMQDALERMGVHAHDEDVRAVLGLPFRRGAAALFQTGRDLEAAVERTDRLHDELVAGLTSHYSRQGATREVEGATAMFTALRELGARVGIGTNLPASVAALILASLDWDDGRLIDVVVTCEEVDDPRPRPGVVREVMARTGRADPGRVLALGDTPACLAEGTLAKCALVVGALRGSHSREELELRPHTHLVEHLDEVTDLARSSFSRRHSGIAIASSRRCS